MPNYLTYPSQIMRITQSYDGTTSHLPHMTGSPKEYALDEGGKDGGRDWLFCGCDAMRVTRLTGVGKPGTNALYVTSTTPVDLANGTRSIITLQLVHPNDEDLCKLRNGQIIKRGEKICREGNDGATGNHVHMAVGLGTIIGTGWQKNSKDRWVLVTTGGPIKPEDAFFIDPTFTTIRDAKGLKFKKLLEKPGVYITTARLNVRTGTTADKIKPDAPVRAVLPAGKRVEVTKTKAGADGNQWGRILEGWICLKYAKKVCG